MINQMEKRVKEERKIMVSKGGVPKGRIIPVYLTDEGDVYPIYPMRRKTPCCSCGECQPEACSRYLR